MTPTLYNYPKLINIITVFKKSLNQRFFSSLPDPLEAPFPPHRLAARGKSFPVDKLERASGLGGAHHADIVLLQTFFQVRGAARVKFSILQTLQDVDVD